jgi:hypothetical protein
VTKLPHHQDEPVRPLSDRERCELRAIEVARNVWGIGHHAPRERAFVGEYDPMTRAWYEVAVFTWSRGIIRVDSRTMDTDIERTP